MAIVLLLGLPVPRIEAQGPVPVVTHLPATVRAAGLAGVSVALVGDAGTVFVNASGLATIRHIGIEGMLSSLPDPARQAAVSGAVRVGQFHLGIGYQYLEQPPGLALRNNTLWVGSLVYRFGMFALGASGKYVAARDSADVVNRSLAGDFSGTMAFFDIFALAVSIQNVASSTRSGSDLALPTAGRLGIMMHFVDPQSAGRLMGTVEVVWTDGEARRTIVGGEAGLVFSGIGVVGRIGYGGQGAATGQTRFAFGGSLVIHMVNVDYAYQDRTVFGTPAHRLGIRLSL